MKTFCAGLIKNNKPGSISIATWIKKTTTKTSANMTNDCDQITRVEFHICLKWDAEKKPHLNFDNSWTWTVPPDQYFIKWCECMECIIAADTQITYNVEHAMYAYN